MASVNFPSLSLPETSTYMEENRPQSVASSRISTVMGDTADDTSETAALIRPSASAPGNRRSAVIDNAWNATKSRYGKDGRESRRNSGINRVSYPVSIPRIPDVPDVIFNKDISKHAKRINTAVDWCETNPVSRFLTLRFSAIFSSPQTFFYLRHHINGLPTEFAMSIALLEVALLPVRYPLGQIMTGVKLEVQARKMPRLIERERDFVLFIALGRVLERHLFLPASTSLEIRLKKVREKYAGLSARDGQSRSPKAVEQETLSDPGKAEPEFTSIQRAKIATASHALKEYVNGKKTDEDSARIIAQIESLADDFNLQEVAAQLMERAEAASYLPADESPLQDTEDVHDSGKGKDDV